MEDTHETDDNSALPMSGPDFNMALPIHTRVESNMPSLAAPVPSLQQQRASLQSAMLGSARNVLAKGFQKILYQPLPTASLLVKQHREHLLTTPLGRDLDIVTASGLEFKIHSSMVIGGPLAMQRQLYPFDVPYRSKVTRIYTHIPPVLVDRLIQCLYTADYEYCPSGTTQLTLENLRFSHATFIPSGPALPPVLAMVGIPTAIFHLCMYSVGEQLEYEALKTRAYDKLMSALINKHWRAEELKKVVVATFAPRGDHTPRICQDVHDDLQMLVAAAVIICEVKEWSDEERKYFAELLPNPGFGNFWDMFKSIKGDNGDLIQLGLLNSQVLKAKPAEQSNGGHAHQLRAGRGGIEKRTKDVLKARREERAKLRGDLGGEDGEDEEDDEEELANVHQRLADMSL